MCLCIDSSYKFCRQAKKKNKTNEEEEEEEEDVNVLSQKISIR